MVSNLKIKSRQDLNQTSTEPVVVQCSFCQTKYSVPVENLAGRKVAKFHCFCCDNVFSFNCPVDNSQEMGIARESDESFAYTSSTPREQTSFGFVSGLKIKNQYEAPSQSMSEMQVGHRAMPSIDASYQQKRIEQKRQKVAEQSSFAIDNSMLNNFSARKFCKKFVFTENEAAHEVPTHNPKNNWSFALPTLSVPRLNFRGFNLSMPNLKSPAFFAEWKDGIVKMKSKVEGECSDAYRAACEFKDQFQFYGKRASSNVLPSESLDLKAGATGLGQKLLRMCLLASPLLLILAALYCLSVFTVSSPERFSPVFNPIVSSKAQVSPPGVGVRSLVAEQVSLDNGSEVMVVKGQIYNNSQQTITNPVIEAALFDAEGGMVTRKVANLSGNMAGVQLEGLNTELLEELHNFEGQAKIQLLPSEQKEFLVAFWQRMDSEPSFYASRVFSVS